MAVQAEFVTTEGSFTVKLFDEETPNTVANFVGLAEGTKEWTDPRTRQKTTAPYYNGIIFHRVIDGFMAQTVDLHGTDASEKATIERGEGFVTVTLQTGSDAPYYRRRFIPSETREIRLYLHDGDDQADE